MRTRLIVFIAAVILMLAAVLFGEGSYKPFRKLKDSELAAVTLRIGSQDSVTRSDPGSLSRCAAMLRTVSVLFAGEEGETALAVLEIEFSDGEKAALCVYEAALSLDEKTYSIRPEESAALLQRIEAIP